MAKKKLEYKYRALKEKKNCLKERIDFDDYIIDDIIGSIYEQ